jgi:hypothetical protein
MKFLRPFLALSGLGLVGVLSLVPGLGTAIEQIRHLPGAPPVSDAALTAILLVQPAVLVLIAVATGVMLTERAGLVSVLLRRCRGKAAPEAETGWLLALLLAVIAGAAAAAADLILRRLSPGSFADIPRLDDVTLSGRIAALLYGGVTEELMLRFGLMTLLVWLGTLALRGRRPGWLVWTAIVLTALAFAAGHLPALMSLGQPDTLLILRTLALNGGLGLVYGRLYASRSLEHAMLAHMATHGVFWTATPLLSAFGL